MKRRVKVHERLEHPALEIQIPVSMKRRVKGDRLG